MDRRIWTHAKRLDRKAQSMMRAYAGATAPTFDGTRHPKEGTGMRPKTKKEDQKHENLRHRLHATTDRADRRTERFSLLRMS